jgi:hypothetical protein
MDKYIATSYLGKGVIEIYGTNYNDYISIVHLDSVKRTHHLEDCKVHYDNQGLYFLYRTPFSEKNLPTRYNLKDFK